VRRGGSRGRDGWSDRGRTTPARTARPHTLDPRRRKFCERFGWHAAGPRADCVRRYAQRDEGAFTLFGQAAGRRSMSAVASAMAESTKGELKPVSDLM